MGSRRQRRKVGGRTEVFKVRVDTEQKALLKARAEELGVSVQLLMVEAALSEERPTLPTRKAAITTLSVANRKWTGVANNLNQLAFLGNAKMELPEGLESCIAEVRESVAELREHLDRWEEL